MEVSRSTSFFRSDRYKVIKFRNEHAFSIDNCEIRLFV